MKNTKTATLVAAVALGLAFLVSSPNVLAQASEIQQGINDIGGGDSPSLIPSVKQLINVFLYIIGALSVIMIIYSGFKYVTSAGDSTSVASAKNTLMYAVIGLAIAILAFSIVNFVLDAVNGTSASNEAGRNAGGAARDAAREAADAAR